MLQLFQNGGIGENKTNKAIIIYTIKKILTRVFNERAFLVTDSRHSLGFFWNISNFALVNVYSEATFIR